MQAAVPDKLERETGLNSCQAFQKMLYWDRAADVGSFA